MKPNDSLPEEQLSRREIVTERIDPHSSTTRHRTLDGTVFDVLMLAGKITVAQHGAAEMFLADLSKAGACLQSPSLEQGSSREAYKVGDDIASRIMVLKAPIQAVNEKAGAQAMLWLYAYIHGVNTEATRSNEGIAWLRRALDALAIHYRVEMSDPRDLCRQ